MCDCDTPTISRTTTRKARVEHKCLECGVTIRPGEGYVENAQLAEGAWATWKCCAACQALYGEYWDLTDCCAVVGDFAQEIADFAGDCGRIADVPDSMIAFAERRGDGWLARMREAA
jgi:hypothetical protein